MSEDQYHKFQAMDRPPGKAEGQALRNLPNRARITATSFTNHCEWGDFKGDSARLIERYFNFFLCLVNGRVRCFVFSFLEKINKLIWMLEKRVTY